MTRIYYVDCCDVCPNNDDESYEPRCCRMSRMIPDDTTVPDWCPLPAAPQNSIEPVTQHTTAKASSHSQITT